MAPQQLYGLATGNAGLSDEAPTCGSREVLAPCGGEFRCLTFKFRCARPTLWTAPHSPLRRLSACHSLTHKDPLYKRYLEQFKDPLILLLLGSAVLSLLIKQYDDAISIFMAVTIVATVSATNAQLFVASSCSLRWSCGPAAKRKIEGALFAWSTSMHIFVLLSRFPFFVAFFRTRYRKTVMFTL